MSVRPASLAALLFTVLTLLVAGCGGDDETTASSSGEQATATATATQDADSTPDVDQGEDPANDQGEDPGEEEGGDGDSEEEREREEQEAKEAGGKECADAGDLDADPKLDPPADLKVPASAHLYESEGPFGKTERFFAVLDGTPEDLASARDEAQKELVDGSGYTSLSTDEEEGSEAEAHLKGAKNTIDIQVAPLCDGKIRIRYTVS
jgi:hypothetical protein